MLAEKPAPCRRVNQPRQTWRVTEFVGTPGSGKSTIERALREELVARGYDPVPPGGFYVWARIGRHRFSLTPIVLLMRVLAGGIGTWRFFSKMLWWCLAMPPARCKHLGNILVLSVKRAWYDAWLTHALLSGGREYVLYSEFFLNSVAKLVALRKLCLKDGSVWISNFYEDANVLFIYVDASTDELLRRLESRAKLTSHVQRSEKSQAAEYLERFKHASESCVNYAASQSGAAVVRVSGGDPIETTVRNLIGELVTVSQCGNHKNHKRRTIDA